MQPRRTVVAALLTAGCLGRGTTTRTDETKPTTAGEAEATTTGEAELTTAEPTTTEPTATDEAEPTTEAGTATTDETMTPYSADDPAANVDEPRDLRVENDDSESHELQIRVRADETTVFEQTWQLAPGESARATNLVAKRRTYTVTARLDGGEVTTAEWPVSDSVHTLDVTILAGGRVDLVPIYSEGTTATATPDDSVAVTQLPYTADEPTANVAEARRLTVVNETDGVVGIRLQVTGDGRELFERPFKLPPGHSEETQALIRKRGTYRVTASRVRTPASVTADWTVEDSSDRDSSAHSSGQLTVRVRPDGLRVDR